MIFYGSSPFFSCGHHQLPEDRGEQRDQRNREHAEYSGPHPDHHHRHERAGRLPGSNLWRGALLRLLARLHDRQELIRSGEL